MKRSLEMSVYSVFVLSIASLLFICMPSMAECVDVEDLETIEHQDIADGLFTQYQLRRIGMLRFTTPFIKEDGYGDGPFDDDGDTRGFRHRPTLQGNGTFLRVNGLDAQSCNECHVFVSHKERPPKLGIAGVGAASTNAIIMPTLIDVADTQDPRVSGPTPELPLLHDGIADYNGRFANPPFLYGGGGVELLGKEMTTDLQDLLITARTSPASTVVQLDTHGVNFGYITSLGGGNVDMSNVEGVGPVEIDSVDPEEALVVRPFGRKGENFTMRDFDRGAMQFHFGIQPVEVVGDGTDPDDDDVIDEVSVGEMSALHIFDVTNPRPFIESLGAKGRQGFNLFKEVGCNSCHKPALRTNSKKLPLSHPEIATDPSANVYREINLRLVGFNADPQGPGVIVPLFADLKRHDMGEDLAETFISDGRVISNSEFTTARLWGIADTAPYLHDGRALTLREAIEAHGGEAEDVRNNFLALDEEQKNKLLFFLGKLRTPENPNEELVR